MEFYQNYMIIGVIVLVIVLLAIHIPFDEWFKAKSAGVKISIFELFLMELRKSPIKNIINGLIISKKGGLKISKEEFEALGLAGANIDNIVNGMLLAKKTGLKLSLKNAEKADSHDVDIIKAVKGHYEGKQEKDIIFE